MTPAEIRDATAERSPWGVASLYEHRPDFGHGSGGHHLISPSGVVADVWDDRLCVSFGRVNNALWDEWIAAKRGAVK